MFLGESSRLLLLTSCLLPVACPAQTTIPPPQTPPGRLDSTGVRPALGQIPQSQTVLYGTSYYSEYMPYERLDQDITLMRQAGIDVVRMGESTWSLWEPEDGHFDYSWMDRVIEAMGKAHIKVILGTPTYSIPPWMYKEHPEILARPLGGAPVFYGMRQNIDTDNEVFRSYARRVITNLVTHYRDNPTVIGWQVDNETSSNGASNPDVFEGFRKHLETTFGTPEALNKAWFLQYWGQTIHDWDELPGRDGAQSTGYKLEWSRWQQIRVTDYLGWQAGLVRQYRRPDQFVTQDFAGAMHRDVNEFQVARSLDVASTNPYYPSQIHMDGAPQALIDDYVRSLKQTNFLVTETNAESTDWTSAWQFPPFDGQLRLNVYTHIANGANMVAFWHWHSIHSGQETYWKGILGHDLEPGRTYAEVSRTGLELARIGPKLANLRVQNKVAILYSVDSANALDFMPFTHGAGPQWSTSTPPADYGTLVSQLHHTLYDLNIGVDFVFPEQLDLSRYSVLIVPALYIANDALLEKISTFVQNGGHVLMTFKSGFCDENSAVRPTRMPGPLRKATGFSYQEFSNLEHSIELRGDPFHVGRNNRVQYWAEFLKPQHAKPLAFYQDTFLGRYPAITLNRFGTGTLTYEGTWLSAELQRAVIKQVLKRARIPLPDIVLPSAVKVHHTLENSGHMLHFYFNYSSHTQTIHYTYPAGTNLLAGSSVLSDQVLTLPPWGLALIEQH
jgi:beta-galactosidase